MRLVVNTLASNVGAQVLAVSSGPALAHSLTVDNRGFLAAAVAGTGVCTSLGSIGLPDAVGYAIASSQGCTGCIRSATRHILAVIFPLIAAAAFGVLFVEGITSRAGVACVVAGAAAAGLGSVNDVQRFVLVGELRYVTLNRERWLAAAVRLVGILGLIVGGRLTLTTSIVAAITLPSAFSYLFLLTVSSRARHTCEGLLRTARHRTLLSYGLRAWSGHALGFTTARLDQLVIGPVVSAHALGLYAIAANYSELPSTLLLTARQFVLPEQARGQERDLTIVSRVMFTASTVLVVPLTCLVAPFLIPLAFGSAYRGSVPLTIVLCLGIPAWMCSGVLGSIMEGRGRPGTVSLSSVAGVLVTLAGLPLLLPQLGAMGASVVTVLSATASLIALLGPTAKATGVSRRRLLLMDAADLLLLRSARKGLPAPAGQG